MTLKELIDQCMQIENNLTSCEIPLKYHGRDTTLKLKLEIDKDADELYVDTRFFVNDNEILPFAFPIK